tara:strand:+ start:20276 stop:20785 length:510 start_codon:yes stop_codon:yes gene_type:complete
MRYLKYLIFIQFLFISSICNSQSNQWENFGFGAGLSFTWDLGSNDRVNSAKVVDGIVRIDDKENGLARVILEAHYFLDFTKWGWGPFVALQPGGSELIDAIGAGIMFGFRKDNSSDISFNLGFGVMADPNTQILGEGIEANKPLPGNETEIRYSNETQAGLVTIFSTSW